MMERAAKLVPPVQSLIFDHYKDVNEQGIKPARSRIGG